MKHEHWIFLYLHKCWHEFGSKISRISECEMFVKCKWLRVECNVTVKSRKVQQNAENFIFRTTTAFKLSTKNPIQSRNIKQIVICIWEFPTEEETKELFTCFPTIVLLWTKGITSCCCNEAGKFVIQWLFYSAYFYRNSCEIYKCWWVNNNCSPNDNDWTR